jgi:FkbM family methyltransferase
MTIGKDLSSKITIRKFGEYNIAFRKNTSDEQVIAGIFKQEKFFKGVPEYKPKQNHIIIDVGAHIGTFSLLASSKVKKGIVHSIEASQESYDLLRINVALNKVININTHHLALSDKNEICYLYQDVGNWGHTIVSNVSRITETVECCSLQTFLDKNGIEKCHFIKLNCEGAEFPILLHSSRYTLQHFEVMLILYHNDRWSANSFYDLIDHLQASGFTTRLRNQTKKRGWIIAINRNP